MKGLFILLFTLYCVVVYSQQVVVEGKYMISELTTMTDSMLVVNKDTITDLRFYNDCIIINEDTVCGGGGGSETTIIDGQVGYGGSVNQLTSDSNLAWDSLNQTLVLTSQNYTGLTKPFIVRSSANDTVLTIYDDGDIIGDRLNTSGILSGDIVFGGKSKSTLATQRNVYIGDDVEDGATFGVCIGDFAGLSNKGDENTFVGYYANGSGANCTSNNNTIVGSSSSSMKVTTGGSNTAIGSRCAWNVFSTSNWTTVGAFSGKNGTGTDRCSFGYNTGTVTTGGAQGSFYGTQSGNYSNFGVRVSCYGWQSGYNTTNTGQQHCLFGSQAGSGMVGTGSYTIAVGALSGRNTDSEKGVFIGYNVGLNETTDEVFQLGNGADLLIDAVNASTDEFTINAELEVRDDIIQKMYTNDVSNPPTDAELDAIYGLPSAVGAGFTSYIDDNGAGTAVYQIVSDGSNWWVFTGTKAL